MFEFTATTESKLLTSVCDNDSVLILISLSDTLLTWQYGVVKSAYTMIVVIVKTRFG